MTDEQIIGYVSRFGGMCRDCADENGVCPHSGAPCDSGQRRAVIAGTIEALRYGIEHRFIPNIFASFGAGGSAECGAHQGKQTLTQEQCAGLVDQMLQEPGWAANDRSRLALTVAARTIRRGRALGSHEKWENIKAFCEANGDD